MNDTLFWDMSEDNSINFNVKNVTEIATKSAIADGATIYFVTMTMADGEEYIMAESISFIESDADDYGKMFAESLMQRINIINAG